MRKHWKKAMALLVIGVMAVVIAGARRVHLPSEFCRECLLRQDATEWRVLGRWRVLETKSVVTTPVSELLAEKHLCREHEHVWYATRYVANPEPADAPPVLSLGLLNQPRVVNFLRDVFNYSDADSMYRWRDLARKVEYASSLDSALRFCRFPEEGFPDSTRFHAWWGESAFPLFNRLVQMNELD